jgi:flavodoxin I
LKRKKIMSALIVYDSIFGNTEKIARAIARAMEPGDEVMLRRVGEANPIEWTTLDLLIVGSPTQGGRPTPAIQEFLRKIPANALKNVQVTAFDTRFSAQEQGLGLRLLMRILGYAAERMARSLQDKGGHLATPPVGFIVEGKEGPLQEDELERAANWGSTLGRAANNLRYAYS